MEQVSAGASVMGSAARSCEGLRSDFPVLSRNVDGVPVVYLDSAATSLKPQSVIDEVVRYYAEVGANIHRGKHMLSEEASDGYEAVRFRVADFFGCQANEVVFLRNTTEALNVVASGLGLESGDVALVPLDSHHSQLLPWRRVARVEMVNPHPIDGIDLDHFADLLRLRPAVVALSACSNISGTYIPLEQVVAMAKGAGATVVVDAAQWVPHRRLQFLDLGADFVAISGHKMLGPSGTGVLIGKAERLRELSPTFTGGGTVDWVDVDEVVLRRPPHRFEAGTPNIGGVYGLGAALDYLDRVGMDVVAQHDQEMAEVLRREVSTRERLIPTGGLDAREQAAIVSFGVRGLARLGTLARVLSDSYGVMCRSGHLCAQPFVDHAHDGEVLRISAYLYNTAEELTTAFAALDEVLPNLWQIEARQ